MALVGDLDRLDYADADVVVLSACVQMPSLAAIGPAEARSGKPVYIHRREHDVPNTQSAEFSDHRAGRRIVYWPVTARLHWPPPLKPIIYASLRWHCHTYPPSIFGPYLQGTPAGKNTVASQIAQACTDIGFIILINHGVSLQLGERVSAAAKAFFRLPLEEKMKVARPPNTPRGYSPIAGGECVLRQLRHDDTGGFEGVIRHRPPRRSAR